MSQMTSPRWYVVQTQVNAEGKAAANLLRQGYQVYLPRHLKRRCHARKNDFVARPFFPRYMFVAIDMATQRWRSVQSTFGVSHLITRGDTPAVVPDDIIASLKQRENDDGFILLDRKPLFASGDRIRVVAGALKDNVGLFDGMADLDRISILLDMLGRKVRVRLDAELVAAA